MMKSTLLQKMALFLSLLLVCNWGYAAEMQKITFTWKGNGEGTRDIKVAVAFMNAGFTIDWGDGNGASDEKYGENSIWSELTPNLNIRTYTSPVYGDTDEHTVILTGTGNIGATSFTVLEIPDCEVTMLDVSGTMLRTLNVSNNNLTSLNVSGLGSLNTLYAYNNNLTDLDASEAGSLETLDVYNNKLANLDISTNGDLKSLSVSDNELTNLNISANSKLKSLDVTNNELANLDVSQNKKLLDVACNNNKLSLANLFDISEKTTDNQGFLNINGKSKIRDYGTQILDAEDRIIQGVANLATCAKFNKKETSFVIYKDFALASEDCCEDLGSGVFKFWEPGEYKIEMTNSEISANEGFEAKVIATYNVSSTTSVEENEVVEFSLYPNPVVDRLYIQSDESDIRVAIYNLNGQAVLQTLYTIDGVDLSGLPNGTYLLKTTNMKNTRHAKFIKK